MQRQDLTPLEEANAYQQLLENYGMTQEQVADRVGQVAARDLQHPAAAPACRPRSRSRSTTGELSAGHVRALVGMEDAAYATHLAEPSRRRGVERRQMEEAVRTAQVAGERRYSPTGVRQLRPVEIIELEKRLTERLGAPVKINYRNEKGKMEIRFGSLEELERLYRRFNG